MSVQQKEATVVITPNIEKAFIFVGGQESKDLYDSRIVEAERERIIKVIHAYAMKDWTLELDESLKESLAFVANTYSNMGHDFGVIDERDRIIKLLEESACCQDECSFHEELTNMIALIKGENK